MRRFGPTVALKATASVVLLASMLTACSTTRASTDPVTRNLSASECQSLKSAAIDREQNSDPNGELNEIVATLSESCSDEFNIIIDYTGMKLSFNQFGVSNCTEWVSGNMHPEAIQYFREDGSCTDGGAPTPTPTSWPEGGLAWDAAGNYVGSYQRVCGPLASARVTDDGIFVNVGQDYPSLGRFTFIVWGDWWMDTIPSGAVICAAGNIYLYEGVTQMEIGHPNDLEIWH